MTFSIYQNHEHKEEGTISRSRLLLYNSDYDIVSIVNPSITPYMTSHQKRKLFCYVDETGQDTRGDLFIVSVVITQNERDRLEQELERIEQESGKGRVKWMEARDTARMEYIKRVLALTDLKGKLTYLSFRDTRDYMSSTVLAVAQAVGARSTTDDSITVFVDGLPRARVKWFATELRHLRVPVKKVRGVRREEASALMRLADALCGFVRAALEGRNDCATLLHDAQSRGVVKES